MILFSRFPFTVLSRFKNQTSGMMVLKIKIATKALNPRKTSPTVHVLRVAVSVNPDMPAKMQNPESFIQPVTIAPTPIAAAR